MKNDIKTFIQQENEKLAFLVSGHIDRLEKKIEQVENKVEQVENKMARTEDIENIANHLERIENKYGQALDKLTDNVRVLKTKAGIR